MDNFSDNLENVIIDQARKMINYDLYTKAILSALPVALLATEKDGKIRTVNQAAEEILGISSDDIRSKPLRELFKSESDLAKNVDLVFSQESPVYMQSATIRLSSGKEIIGNFSLKPLFDEEECFCGVLLAIEDQSYIHFLQDAFKQYVPASISEVIANDPQNLTLGGEEKVLTVLFSDLVSFTSISERYSPSEMVKMLGDYFSEMTGLVFDYDGTLLDYIGDELMAIFGAPVEQPDHARRTCRAALAMNNRLKAMRKEWTQQGRPALRARIGVNSGPMLVGNLGSKFRFSYDVIGDHVNLASRLEGLSSKYGTEILIGENTYEMVYKFFRTRQIDRVKVKGREQPVRIYELLSEIDQSLETSMENAVAYYEAGLKEYWKKNWAGALTNFKKSLSHRADDGPSLIMSERCQLYLENQPPDDWDGVFRHDTK